MIVSLLRLVRWLVRRHGRIAVALLIASARAWIADPDNERVRRDLVRNLRDWSGRAGGKAGRSAARLARQIERRRATVAGWERELSALRYEIIDLPQGTAREAALDTYCTHCAAGFRFVERAVSPAKARRRVLAALASEEALIPGEGMSSLERERALEAVDRARAACYRVSEARVEAVHRDKGA